LVADDDGWAGRIEEGLEEEIHYFWHVGEREEGYVPFGNA